MPSDLADVVAAWDSLPASARRALLEILRVRSYLAAKQRRLETHGGFGGLDMPNAQTVEPHYIIARDKTPKIYYLR